MIVRIGLLSILGAIFACGPTDPEPTSLVSEAIDSAEVIVGESSLLIATTDQVDMMGTPEAAAISAAASAKFFFVPSDCVTATVNDTVVNYEMVDKPKVKCRTAHRLTPITGTIDLIFSKGFDGLHADAKAMGLSVGGAMVNMETGAVLSGDSSSKKMSVHTNGSGVGPRGNAFDRKGGYTVTWDDTQGCLGLDGTWAVTSVGKNYRTTVSSFQVCTLHCPANGGRIRYEGEIAVTIDFDGSDQASWKDSKGHAGTFPLACVPAGAT